ncbi:hypothetical protein RI129_002420 [Pyrocoelia pectoralis]|uniref:Uncharacterized protein n=1 Tax=Pyrocoelia pectoralis TaxID=417401 RepID=A0AAN7ZTI0_9COLE
MNNVIILFLIATYVQVSFGSEDDNINKIIRITEMCVNENNLNATKVNSVWVPGTIPENDDDIITFFLCSFRKLHIFDERNLINYDNLRYNVPSFLKITFTEIMDYEKITNGIAEDCFTFLQTLPSQIHIIKIRNCGVSYAQSRIAT